MQPYLMPSLSSWPIDYTFLFSVLSINAGLRTALASNRTWVEKEKERERERERERGRGEGETPLILDRFNCPLQSLSWEWLLKNWNTLSSWMSLGWSAEHASGLYRGGGRVSFFDISSASLPLLPPPLRVGGRGGKSPDVELNRTSLGTPESVWQ